MAIELDELLKQSDAPIPDAKTGIKALLDARAYHEDCVKACNIALQEVRGMIDGRTIGVPRKPRVAAASDTPEPPAAA